MKTWTHRQIGIVRLLGHILWSTQYLIIWQDNLAFGCCTNICTKLWPALISSICSIAKCRHANRGSIHITFFVRNIPCSAHSNRSIDTTTNQTEYLNTKEIFELVSFTAFDQKSKFSHRGSQGLHGIDNCKAFKRTYLNLSFQCHFNS